MICKKINHIPALFLRFLFSYCNKESKVVVFNTKLN